MIATFYLIISAMCFVALYYSFKLWRQHPNPITLLILIPLLFLWLDNFAIATGKWVGEGPILTGMTFALLLALANVTTLYDRRRCACAAFWIFLGTAEMGDGHILHRRGVLHDR